MKICLFKKIHSLSQRIINIYSSWIKTPGLHVFPLRYCCFSFSPVAVLGLDPDCFLSLSFSFCKWKIVSVEEIIVKGYSVIKVMFHTELAGARQGKMIIILILWLLGSFWGELHNWRYPLPLWLWSPKSLYLPGEITQCVMKTRCFCAWRPWHGMPKVNGTEDKQSRMPSAYSVCIHFMLGKELDFTEVCICCNTKSLSGSHLNGCSSHCQRSSTTCESLR